MVLDAANNRASAIDSKRHSDRRERHNVIRIQSKL